MRAEPCHSRREVFGFGVLVGQFYVFLSGDLWFLQRLVNDGDLELGFRRIFGVAVTAGDCHEARQRGVVSALTKFWIGCGCGIFLSEPTEQIFGVRSGFGVGGLRDRVGQQLLHSSKLTVSLFRFTGLAMTAGEFQIALGHGELCLHRYPGIFITLRERSDRAVRSLADRDVLCRSLET